MEKVSIIVPVYNVEDYIKRCIDSLIYQTYKNIEILLVDDGSTDKSGNICDEFGKVDKRIKVIHKKNGGLSDARNIGIQESKGNYLCFIDSDDFIEKDMIEKLYNSIKKHDSDIACCAKVIEFQNKKIVKNNGKEFCINNIQALSKILSYEQIDTSACDKMFKKQLFNNIRFPKNRYYEDMGTIYKLFEISDKISHISDIGYHYYMRVDSITTERFSKKQFDSLYFAKEIKNDFGNKYYGLKEKAEAFYYLEMLNILVKIKKSENYFEFKNEYNRIKKEYNKNIIKIIKNNSIKIHKKIMAIFVYFKLYKIVIYLKNN